GLTAARAPDQLETRRLSAADRSAGEVAAGSALSTAARFRRGELALSCTGRPGFADLIAGASVARRIAIPADTACPALRDVGAALATGQACADDRLAPLTRWARSPTLGIGGRAACGRLRRSLVADVRD